MHPRAAIAATGTLKSLCIGQAGHTTFLNLTTCAFSKHLPYWTVIGTQSPAGRQVPGISHTFQIPTYLVLAPWMPLTSVVSAPLTSFGLPFPTSGLPFLF